MYSEYKEVYFFMLVVAFFIFVIQSMHDRLKRVEKHFVKLSNELFNRLNNMEINVEDKLNNLNQRFFMFENQNVSSTRKRRKTELDLLHENEEFETYSPVQTVSLGKRYRVRT